MVSLLIYMVYLFIEMFYINMGTLGGFTLIWGPWGGGLH